MKRFNYIRRILEVPFGKYFKVAVDYVLNPCNSQDVYYHIKTPDFVCIIPIDSDGNIFMVKQHRYTIDQVSLELPTGHAEEQINDDDTESKRLKKFFHDAKRELLEETGLTTTNDKWFELGWFHAANGISDVKGYIFIAKDVIKEREKKDFDDEAILSVEKLSLKEIIDKIKFGQITDGPTISCIAMAIFNKWIE